jgi:hypothetical protein
MPPVSAAGCALRGILARTFVICCAELQKMTKLDTKLAQKHVFAQEVVIPEEEKQQSKRATVPPRRAAPHFSCKHPQAARADQ